MNDKLFNTLYKLADIFKDGYTITIKNGKIRQYMNFKRPYIVSYRTLAILGPNTTKIECVAVPNECIVGYWVDPAGVGWIELNKSFSSLTVASNFALYHNQECIFDYLTGRCIKCK